MTLPPFETVLRAVPRGDLRIPLPPGRSRAGRGCLPGDVPPRSAGLSQAAARRASASVGVHDRQSDRDRRASAPARRRGPAGDRRARRTARIRAARAPRRPAASDGTRRSRAALRLRPRLRGDRRRPRLERHGGQTGRIRRHPPATTEGAFVNAVSPELDRRFRDAAAAEGLLDAAFDFVDSPVGPLLVATSARGLCRISYDADPERELEQLARDFGVRVLRSAKPIDPARARARRVLRGQAAHLRPSGRRRPARGLQPPRASRACARPVRRGRHVRRAGRTLGAAARGSRRRHGDEQKPAADRPAVPPRGRRERQARRLRRRARAQGKAAQARRRDPVGSATCIAGEPSAARSTASPPLPTTASVEAAGQGANLTRVMASRAFPHD